jgi:amylosucrase
MRMPDLPLAVREAADKALATLSAERIEIFDVRLTRWYDDLHAALEQLYGDAAGPLEERVVGLAGEAYRLRESALSRLDLARSITPDWLQFPEQIGYAAYADRFAGDLAGVGKRIGFLRELGVTYLHLMPILKPRLGDSDGGYAVADYRNVDPGLGTIDDLQALARLLRRNGISLVADLVLNHVAREHEWATAARTGDEHFHRYFHIYPDRTEPDAYERTLPEVFPDFAPGNFTWDDDVNGWVWTTFNSWQWDVNWTNPDVFAEYTAVVLLLANLGVEVLRLDALAFMWKRLGTNCQNQPEVHQIVKALRALTRIACPAVAFKAEAIVAPRDLVQYLGRGGHEDRVSQLAYHNSLMVQVWSMLAAGNAVLAAEALRALPAEPSTATWLTYVRCHDDIGWAIDDEDARAARLDGFSHRKFLVDFYTGDYPGSMATGLVFQYNPQTGDRRTSGMTASLMGLEAARAQNDPVATNEAIARIRLAYAIVCGWGGIPVLWMGDEIGLGNDPNWASEPGHANDNRWAHRPRMPWDLAARRHDMSSIEGRVFAAIAGLARRRASLDAMHASTKAQVLELSDPGILPVGRPHPTGSMLGLYNVTSTWRPWPSYRLEGLGIRHAYEVIDGEHPAVDEHGNFWLPPYAAWWLVSS